MTNPLDAAIDREVAKMLKDEAPIPATYEAVMASAVAGIADLRRQREAWEKEQEESR